jgi:hypothetical protein
MSFALIAAAAGSLLAAGRTIQLKKDADTIQTEVKGAIHSIKADGGHIRLDVKLKNPSKTGFTFSFPFLKLISSRGNTIGSSQADSSVIELKAGEEQTLKPIMLTIPLSEILSLSIEVFKAITEGKAGLKIDVVTSSYAHLLMGAVKHKVEWHNMITLIRDKTNDKK